MAAARSSSSYLAIVPAYNEAETLAGVLASLARHEPDFDVLVVDDGSTDNTSRVATANGARVLRLPFNVGIGGAVQSGFLYACEHGYDYVVQVDADAQHDPSQIRKLITAMDEDPGLDMVCGSRFLQNGSYPAPISRRTGIHLFAAIVSLITGQRITDPTSGFRLCNRHAMTLFARDYPHDFPEVEAIVILHRHQLRMGEVPVLMFRRGGGVSSISSGKSAYYMVKVLLALFINLVRTRPVVEPGGEAPVTAIERI
jgi:glycosyltransferase involved in cell wall biosynthesis